MRPPIEATAEGDLGRTPFAQLFAFTLERRLSGSLFLVEPGGTEHVIAFERGLPAKVRPSDTFARLGALLVEDGALDAGTLEQALATPGLLGDVLLIGEAVTSAALQKAVERQFSLRLTRLFALPAETTWAFFEGHGELDAWGGEPATADALAVLWAGVRANAEAMAPVIEATLALLGETPVRAAASAPAERFGFDEVEKQALELLQLDTVPLSQTVALDVVPEDVLRRVLYVLLLTQQLAGSPSGGGLVDEPTAPAAVGRVQLRSTLHRHGAAAPDLPGDGERAPVVSRRAKKPVVDAAPPSSPQLPVAAVEPTPSSQVAAPEPAPAPQRERLAPAEAFALATAKLEARELPAAVVALDDALAVEPANADYRALALWLRAEQPHADVKALTIELDELLAAHDDHVPARYYRALLRKRLSNSTGATRDLRRVLELEPSHLEAKRLLDSLVAQEQDKPPPSGGLLARLFRR